MDTKWKKWKNRIGFIFFAIGFSTLILGVTTELHQVTRNSLWDGTSPWGLTDDYQETDAFKYFMSEKLNDYLAIANRTYVDWDYSCRVFDDCPEDTATSYSDAYEGSCTAEASEEAEEISSLLRDPNLSAEEQSELNNRLDALYSKNSTYVYEDNEYNAENFSAEQLEMMAKNYLKYEEKNQNILYEITNNGKVLYTNMETPYHNGFSLPEGYNYVMRFNGKQVEINKDGQEIDVYGDGVYTGESEYQVPGYTNFTADDSLRNITVTLVVIKTPLQYRITGGRDSYYSNGSLYAYYQDLQQLNNYWKKAYQLCVIGLSLLFLSALLLWKASENKKKFAEFISKIWIEVKIILLLVLIRLSVVNLNVTFDNGYMYDYQCYTEDYGYNMQAAQYYMRDWFRALENNPLLVLLVSWFLLLLVVDIIYNHKKKPNSLLNTIFNKLNDRTLTMDFTKKQVRRMYILITAIIAVFISLIIGVLFYAYYADVTILFIILSVIILISALIWYCRTQDAQAHDLELLSQQISRISCGNYAPENIAFQGKDLTQISENLLHIQNGMKTAVEDQLHSERMKVDLVANVSHDLKTPLTSIISYINFLKEEDGLPDHVKDYIQILDEKSKRLNEMVKDVFAISKASSGQLPVHLEVLDFGKLLNQTLADMDEAISGSNISIKSDIKEHEYFIKADGQKMYRVCQNLIQNALKYSLEGSRMYISLEQLQGNAIATFKNISKTELKTETDFSARFVRGDESRTDGGSGLGLSIAKSFTEACGGRFTIEINGDMFIVSVIFQTVSEN